MCVDIAAGDLVDCRCRRIRILDPAIARNREIARHGHRNWKYARDGRPRRRRAEPRKIECVDAAAVQNRQHRMRIGDEVEDRPK